MKWAFQLYDLDRDGHITREVSICVNINVKHDMISIMCSVPLPCSLMSVLRCIHNVQRPLYAVHVLCKCVLLIMYENSRSFFDNKRLFNLIIFVYHGLLWDNCFGFSLLVFIYSQTIVFNQFITTSCRKWPQ